METQLTGGERVFNSHYQLHGRVVRVDAENDYVLVREEKASGELHDGLIAWQFRDIIKDDFRKEHDPEKQELLMPIFPVAVNA